MSTEEERNEAVEESHRLKPNFERHTERKTSTKRKLRDLFDVKEVIQGAKLVRVTEVPELGITISWCKLSLTDYAEMNKIQDVQERGYRAVALMIAKANPDRNVDEVHRMLREELALDEFAVINMRLGQEMATFLPSPKR